MKPLRTVLFAIPLLTAPLLFGCDKAEDKKADKNEAKTDKKAGDGVAVEAGEVEIEAGSASAKLDANGAVEARDSGAAAKVDGAAVEAVDGEGNAANIDGAGNIEAKAADGTTVKIGADGKVEIGGM